MKKDGLLVLPGGTLQVGGGPPGPEGPQGKGWDRVYYESSTDKIVFESDEYPELNYETPSLGLSRGYIVPSDFFITGTGDETEKIREMHIAANLSGRKVVYSGVDSIYLQAKAEIEINTDVDFSGVSIHLLGGDVPISPWQPTIPFIIEDPECPLVVVSGTPPSESLRIGSYYPTEGVVDGDCHVHLISDYPVPGRYLEDDPLVYEQSFKLIGSRSVHPLCRDLSSGVSTSMRYRRMSRRRIEIKNVRLIDDGWTSLILFLIRRNGVTIDGVTVDRVSGAVTDSRDVIIQARDCCDLTLQNITATARPYSTGGTYVIGLTRVSEASLRNIYGHEAQYTSWGVTGSNHVSGILIDNCSLNRFDVHNGGFNIWARDSKFHRLGINIGSGGGSIGAENCVFYNCPSFRIRPDYGGYTSNCSVVMQNNRSVSTGNTVFIDLGRGRVGRPGYTTETPSIVLDGLSVEEVPGSGNSLLSIVDFVPSVSSDAVVLAPYNIELRNIRNTVGRAALTIDIGFGGLDSGDAPARRSYLTISGWSAQRNAFYSQDAGGLRGIPVNKALVTPPNWIVQIHDSYRIGVVLEDFSPLELTISGTGLSWIVLPNNCSTIVRIMSCYMSGDSSTNGMVLGTTSWSGNGSMEIYGLAKTRPADLSGARVLTGVKTHADDALPGTCTRLQALQGYAYNL